MLKKLKQIKTRNRPVNSGFTLIEMVIAMGIFIMFLGVVFSSYIQISNAQKRANLNREAVSEAREILSYISQEAKEKAVDYSCYTDSTVFCFDGIQGNEVNQISLISKDGLERTIISKKLNEETKNYEITTLTQVRQSTLRNWESAEISQETPLHSENIQIQSARFEITPNADPFEANFETASNDQIQYQPALNVVLNVKRRQKTDIEEPDEFPIVLQTSISSRIYNSF